MKTYQIFILLFCFVYLSLKVHSQAEGETEVLPTDNSGASVEIDTSLHEAVRQENIELVKRLLEEGADPDEQEGSTKYFSVYSLGKSKKEIEKAKKKINRFFKVSGWTPIHWAVYLNNREILDMLLKRGNPEAKDTFKATPLHWAAKWGHAEIAEYLISLNVDVNAQDINGYTPLHYVMLNPEKNNAAIVDALLVAGADLYVKDKAGRYAVHLASQFGFGDALKKIIDVDNNVIYSKDKNGNTILHIAVANGFLGIAESLLQFSINIDEENYQGLTALHWAVLNQRKKSADLLLSKGANINHQDAKQKTIFHKLAQWNYVEMIRYLIDKYKSDINIELLDKEGQTALHKAVINGNLQVTRILSEITPLEIKDSYGETALQKAVYSGRLRVAKYLIGRNADLTVSTDDRKSLLWEAVRNSDFEMAQLLIERGASVSAEDSSIFDQTKKRDLLLFLRENLLLENNQVQ